MIDAYEEAAQFNQTELTLASIKDFLFSKGGKCKYAELFDRFRDHITDSSSDTKFQEFVSNLAIRKYENDSYEEWIILKKVFYKEQLNSCNTPSSPNTGFFSSKLQKTKQSLTKFSNTLIHQNNKEKCDLSNKSLNSSSNSLNSNCSSSNFHSSSSTSYSSSNLTDLNDFHPSGVSTTKKKKAPKFTSIQSSFYLNTGPNSALTASSRAKSSQEIFETNQLFNNLSLSKSSPKIADQDISINTTISNNETIIEGPNETIVAVKSVKEHAKKLNRLNTQMELSLNSTPQKSRKVSLTKEQVAPLKHIELDNFDLANPDPIEKEWILICSRCEYMEMAKWLSKYPFLAQKKDPFTGYTCAHWACKYGHIEVLKLIASTLENDSKSNPKSIRINHLINSRTRAGYTCLHVAYIFKHGDLAPILKTYGAEGLIDYSGKQAIEYSGKQDDLESFSLSRPYNFDITELYSDSSRKSSNSDISSLGNDLSSIVKRTSSIILKDKDKDYVKFLRPKSSTIQRINDSNSTKTLPPSPLASIEPYQNTFSPNSSNNNSSNNIKDNSGFLHPSVLFRNKQNKKSNLNTTETIYQNDGKNGESKENIFI